MESFCELHVHLEGCVWPEHAKRWWARAELRFPEPRRSRPPSFDAFLEHLRYGYNFLNAAEAYGEVAALYAARAGGEGIRYAELQLNLALLDTWNLPLADVLSAIRERVARVPRAPVLRFVIDLPWQFDAGLLGPVLDDAVRLQERGVRALSFGGREEAARPQELLPICAEARAVGFRILCHAGETGSPEAARRIVELLEPDRITHGVRIADWIAARGRHAPPVDVCLSSNLFVGVLRDLEGHPLRRWWEAGVPVCLSTDDPAIFDTRLSREYELAERLCPAAVSDRGTLEGHWLRAACDPEAAAAALAGAATG